MSVRCPRRRHASPRPRRGRLRGQRLAQTAVADDDQLQIRSIRSHARNGVDQQVEPLLRLEPSRGANDHVIVGELELAPNHLLTAVIASKAGVVDAVQNRDDPVRPRAVPNELAANVSRHRNEPWEAVRESACPTGSRATARGDCGRSSRERSTAR